LAPVEINVLPLVSNKKELVSLTHKIRDQLRKYGFIAEYDASGATIGRRYARSDEIGVPYAVTIDFDTLKNKTVTIRNRDDSKQFKIPLYDIKEVCINLIRDKISFKTIAKKYENVT
jgi:glycyl-tRNA synthetase